MSGLSLGQGWGYGSLNSGAGFFSDPYSAYTQYWVDGLNGNDSNPGTSQLNAKKTLSAGTALLTNGGSVLNVLSTATYAPTTSVMFPAATGTSPTAQVVIRGLPSYTRSQMPQTVFGPNAGFYLNGNNNAVPNLTFWKMNVSSSSSSGSLAQVSLIQFLSQSACVNFQVLYCELHDIYGQDLTACIHAEGSGSTGMQVAYSYLYNVQTSDGSTSDNGACILEYQIQAMYVHHNDMTGAPCLMYFKRCYPGTSNNGPIVWYNRLHDYNNDGVYMGEQGGGDTDGNFDSSFIGNLFLNGVQAIRQNETENTLQSSRCLIQNNTCAGMANDWAFAGMTALNINSNVMMATSQLLELQNPSPLANGISNCNNNAILTSTGQSWNMNEFGTGAQKFTTLATWQTAFSVSGRPELTANPDVNSLGFTTASLGTNFPNNASGDWSIASGSPLFAIGAGGTTPGYSQSNCGPGWS